MIRYFIFTKGKLLDENQDLGFLKVALYDADVQIWADAEQPTPEETKMLLEGVFAFHPLAIEDCVNPSERPKIESYDGYVSMVMHAIDFSASEHKFATTELNLFIGKNFLVTYHEHPMRCVAAAIDRVRKNSAAVARNPDRLTYHILDMLLDNCEPALMALSNDVAELEKKIMVSRSMDTFNLILDLKGQVHELRQIMAPQREVLARLAHGEFTVVRPAMLPYYRDLLDRIMRILDLTETYRESLNSSVQVLLNLQQAQINQVIKVLTVLATLSIPFLVITSFYGMNVQHVPNLEWSCAAAYAWVFGWTGLLTAAIYWLLRRKRWL